MVAYVLNREYPGSFKKNSLAKVHAESAAKYYAIYYNDVLLGYAPKIEIEFNEYWDKAHSLEVGDKVAFGTLVRVVEDKTTTAIRLGNIWYKASEFPTYDISKLEEDSLKLNEELAKYQQKLHAVSNWLYIKKEQPRIYWNEILRLIATEYNNYWKPNFANEEERFQIVLEADYKIVVTNWNLPVNNGAITFHKKEYAEQAIALLRNNINYIF